MVEARKAAVSALVASVPGTTARATSPAASSAPLAALCFLVGLQLHEVSNSSNGLRRCDGDLGGGAD
jgi:hypothetical protein